MLIYLFLLIFIPTILSYLILTFIYRILFKSKEKVSKFLVFLGSIGLIIFYYTPYFFYLEPSYWQFRNMCKLNELPNTEEKYNKILRYFDTDLESLDWEKIKKDSVLLTTGYLEYTSQNDRYMYRYKDNYNQRTNKALFLFFNDSVELKNLYKMDFELFWDDKRKYLTTESVASYKPALKSYSVTCR